MSFDPLSLENLINPNPLYKALRESDPVHWAASVHGWILTRYDDVVSYLRDPRLSANRTNFYEQNLRGMGGDAANDFFTWLKIQMTMHDGAEHIRVRRQASPGFAPQSLDTYRPSIRQHMGNLLDQVQGLGKMDMVPEISYQLPPLVIAEFLGIPSQDRERFRQWAKPLADISNPASGSDPAEVARGASRVIVEMTAYLNAIIEDRRHHPGQDMISMMIQAQELGRMSQEELSANTILVLTAGHLTTTDQLNNGMFHLLSNPGQVHKLQEDRTLLRTAVEEMLRYSPSTPFVFRVAAADIPLRGKTIRKGDTVFLGIAAANRDPAIFPEPDLFDITRDNVKQKHLNFGFGAHHCLGAGLARRELEIATEMMLDRLPGLTLDTTQAPQPKFGLISRGFNSLHVKW